MRKQTKLKIATISTITMAMLPSVTAYAEPPVYMSNTTSEVYISAIDFANDTIDMTYDADAENLAPRIQQISLQYGPMTDYQLHHWSSDKIGDDNVVIYAGTPTNFGSHFDKGKTTTLRRPWLRAAADLLNNGYGRIEYIFLDTKNNAVIGRADYNRCIKSEVFKSGAATICRAEKLSNGTLQYQPYDASGNRLELSPEEDELLTAETINWRAEPGEWGPEWYITSDDSENEDENTSGDDATGGDDTGGGDINADTWNNTIDDTTDSTLVTDSESSPIQTTPVTLANYVTIVATGTDATSNNGTADAVYTNSTSTDDFVVWYGGNDENMHGDTIGEDAAEDDGKNSSWKAGNTANDEVEIPDLGKEPEQSHDWLAPVLIITGLLIAAAGWWLLFFGKRKLTNDEERR